MYAGGRSTDRQYYPERPDYKNTPKYSFGSRREHGPGALTNLVSTPGTVGPGTYFNMRKEDKSVRQKKGGWSFPLLERGNLYGKKYDAYQTYDTRRAIGPQYVSLKKTMPQITFGRETRDGRQKTGMFASSMTQPPLKVVIPHPVF